MRSHPQAAVLHVYVLDPHGGGRTDPGEGVDHQPDQRPIAQADRRAYVDCVEDRTGLVRREHGRLAPLHDMLRPSHGAGRVERQHAAGRQPVEHHPDRSQALLDRWGAVAPSQLLDVGGDIDRADCGIEGRACRSSQAQN